VIVTKQMPGGTVAAPAWNPGVLDENNVVGAAPAGADPTINAAPATRLVAATALASRRIVTPGSRARQARTPQVADDETPREVQASAREVVFVSSPLDAKLTRASRSRDQPGAVPYVAAPELSNS
jgi:hypothetical protein